MSGIAGIYHVNGKTVDPSELRRMTERLAHRGPDGSDTWHEGPIGFGHLMLWTTLESLHEKLPLVSGALGITADARIDNRDELIAALNIATPPTEITDSALILAAYERWGESCAEHLIGDFAFAIWDKEKQQLFCARDHMGVKPFYYYRSDELFVFASEIKAFLNTPGVPCELNELWVASHLTGNYDDREITAYEGIQRLPAAHFIITKQEEAYVRQYWFLDPAREICLYSNEEYAAAFREIFTEAVRCRLRSAFPVGAEVSGGLDSSSVACVARQQLEKQGAPPLLTFSLVFDESPESDESAYARALVAQGGVNPRWIPTGALSPLDVGLHRIFWQDDEPVWAPNIYLTCATMSAAQHAGVRVLLTGLDGDTTVYHGPEYLTELAVTGRWKTLAKNIYGFSKLGDHLSPWKVFWRRVLVPLTPDPIGQLWRLMRRRKQSTPVREDGIKPEFAQRVGFAALTDARQRDRQKPAKTVKQGHYDKLNAGVIQFALEEESRVAGAIGLEERHPFFDKRLIEFCLALPAEQKMYDGWTRIVLRRAMQELLPRKIQWRVSKSNLGPGHVRNLLVNDRALIEGVLADPPQRLEQYIDVPRLRQTFQRYAACPTAPDAMTLWNAVSLALWLPRVGFDNAI